MELPRHSRDSVLIVVARTSAFTDRQYREFYCWLDRDERTRVARFRFESNRREFILAHAMTRWILARCLTEDGPWRIQFQSNIYGKPCLANPEGPAFSLSHCSGAVLCAVAYVEDVGADIEQLQRTSSMSNLFATAFTVSERRVLSYMANYEAERTALKWWTIKESFLKADGRGLGVSPAAICCASDMITKSGQLSIAPELLGYKRPFRYQGEVICGWASHWISWIILSGERSLHPYYLEYTDCDDSSFLIATESWRFSGVCGEVTDF